VLPARNAEETIGESLDSIQRQTFPDWELILVDDGSMDATGAIGMKHAEDDARIRVVSQDPGGIVSALQKGCSAAQTPLLARMDADDRALPRRLELQVALMDAQPDVDCCGCLVRMRGAIASGRRRYERWINRLQAHEDIAREIFVECPIAHPTFVMRREAFESAGGYRDHGWAEDHDLLMRFYERSRRLGGRGGRFAKVPEILLEWRERPDRLSREDPRYSPEQFRKLKRHYLRQLDLPKGRPLYQWGAGEVGKRWLREWDMHAPEAVVDINPRKVGRRIHDFEVIVPEALPPAGDCFVAVAVGAPGARDAIREWLVPRGYAETDDFVFLA
jgi:glycosyltransferase involved in cell wall biosynthesis